MLLNNHEEMEILCTECGLNRFIVIKPKFDLPKSDPYFKCTKCITKISNNNHMWKFSDAVE